MHQTCDGDFGRRSAIGKLPAVYARRADTEIARELFDKLAASAPPPLVARIVADDYEETTANGRVRTVSYRWSLPNVAPGILFTLSVAPLDSAEIQVLGSVAIIR
ncbi:NMCC_0638 family (lipo)protein [Cupriavidus sp. USMAHM13]|uniref:NMCC_0638 family (lipo)protein n=1 Tax=Cupriavidus sp. USMAHM13 TaxID=1389192 RepID=UPI003FA41B5A